MSADVEYTKEELEAIKVLADGGREAYYVNLLTKTLLNDLRPSLAVHPKLYKQLYEQAVKQGWVK